MSTASHLFNNFLGFLAQASASNPTVAPITSAVMAASKGVVQAAESEAPVLVTHELDVIAAHNKNSPYIGVAADIAKLMFSAWAATVPALNSATQPQVTG